MSSIDRVKSAINIIDLMSATGGAELTKHGEKYIGWHTAHESVSKNGLKVDPRSGQWYCHSCGDGGDLISWMGHQLYNSRYSDRNRDMFRHALSEVAKIAGIEISMEDSPQAAERRGIEQVYELAARFYHSQLPQEQREHLHTRYGLSDATIDELLIGFAPPGGRALYGHLSNIANSDLLATGLFTQHEPRIYDTFQGRIMFPYWRGGRVVYLIGRETAHTPDWEQERRMKYKKLLTHNENHPYVSPVVTNAYLYGEDTVRGAADLLVTEGITDAIIAHQAGLSCISPVTVRFRREDAEKIATLAKSVKRVFIVNDNEANNAGTKGARATATLLWESGVQAYMATLPKSEETDKVDLNDYLRSHTAPELRAILAQSQTLLDLAIDDLAKAKEADRNEALETCVRLLTKVENKIAFDRYVTRVCRSGNVSRRTLLDAIKHSEAKPASDAPSDGSKQADRLMTLIEGRTAFFTGSDGGLYASVAVGEHKECHRLNSSAFNEYLSKLYYDECKTVVGAQARADAKSIMSFMARERNEQVYTRVGMGENERVYIDLGTPDWSAIEVDADGWRIVPNPPIYFRRAASAQPLVMPTPSTDLSPLALYLNIEEDQWPLVASFAVATLYPRGPYPILGLVGEQGTAKSTTLRVLKALLDPSAAALRSQPDQIRDLMIAGSNSWLLAFDNVSSIASEMADAMCRISTGGGFSSRANYTDGDEHIIDIMRPQMVNGIGDIFTRGDLIDRTIVINPPVIPEAKRQPEKLFWQQFDRDKAAILGALLHGLSVGIKNLPSVELKEKPRMADFAQFAIAAEPAYNEGGEFRFLDMYMENREDGVSALLESSPLAKVIWELIKVPGEWSGTSRQLYAELSKRATDDDKKNKAGFPTAENRLKNMLQRIAPAMRKRGVDIRYGGKGKKGRHWTIKRIATGDGGDSQNAGN